MAKKSELYELCDRINQILNNISTVHLKVEYENNFYFVRVYKGESCEKTLFGGGTIKEMIESLRAFRQGLLFTRDFRES